MESLPSNNEPKFEMTRKKMFFLALLILGLCLAIFALGFKYGLFKATDFYTLHCYCNSLI